jgi:uncharacterized membrane protein
MLSALSERLRRTDELLRSRVSKNVNEEAAARSTIADRAADLIAEFGGSWKFTGSQLPDHILDHFQLYILVRFDPVPYQMLNLVLAVIAECSADNHDVAEPAGTERPIARGSGLPGESKTNLVAEAPRR